MFDDDEEEERFSDGDLKEDLERFEAFLNGGSIGFLDSDRWEVLLDHLLIAGQYNKAIICADEALTQFSYNAFFKLRKAQALSASGKLKEALNLLTQIEKTELPNFELLLTRASIFSQLKDSTNAIKYFKAALELAEKEDRDEIYLDLAIEYQYKSKFKQAIAVLTEALESNPLNEGAVYEMAHCYEQMGKPEASLKCFSDYIDENPYSFTAWYNLGNSYSRLEDYEKAIWAYDYCLLINEDFGPVYFNLGNSYLSLDKYTKAIENFEKCMELDGEDPIALCYLGECHEQMGELDLAKLYYNKSIELAPQLADAWLGLGIVKDLEGHTKEGIVLIHKASEIDPDNGSIYHVLAGAYEKIDEFDKAQEYYILSLEFNPEDEECLINYINFLKTRSIGEAYSYLTEFEEFDFDNRIAKVLKVSLLWEMGQDANALDLFKTCLIEDKERALELFDINPALKNVVDFVLLADQN